MKTSLYMWMLSHRLSYADSDARCQALLELTAKIEHARQKRIVVGWELGNELNIGGSGNPDAQA